MTCAVRCSEYGDFSRQSDLLTHHKGKLSWMVDGGDVLKVDDGDVLKVDDGDVLKVDDGDDATLDHCIGSEMVRPQIR